MTRQTSERDVVLRYFCLNEARFFQLSSGTPRAGCGVGMAALLSVRTLLRNKIWALCLGFSEIRAFGLGFSDVNAAKQTREWSPKTTRSGGRDCLPDPVG